VRRLTGKPGSGYGVSVSFTGNGYAVSRKHSLLPIKEKGSAGAGRLDNAEKPDIIIISERQGGGGVPVSYGLREEPVAARFRRGIRECGPGAATLKRVSVAVCPR